MAAAVINISSSCLVFAVARDKGVDVGMGTDVYMHMGMGLEYGYGYGYA